MILVWLAEGLRFCNKNSWEYLSKICTFWC